MSTAPQNVQEFGGQHRWAIRYLIDWRPLNKDVHPLLLHATVLRWFHTPSSRAAAVTRAQAWYAPYPLELSEPLNTTVLELENSRIRVGPGYDAATFAGFLDSLRDGNLSTGGSFDDDFPKDWARWRPAFPWMLSRWRRAFPNVPMPWPFFIFPGENHPSPRDQ